MEVDKIKRLCSDLLNALEELSESLESEAADEAQPLMEMTKTEPAQQEEKAAEDSETEENFLWEKEAELISVTGTKHGIGTTHHCILMAALLQNAGVKTAIVDFTDAKGMENCGIPYYHADENILDEITYQYQVILLDLGVFSECNRGMFRRGDKRIIIAGFKPWEKKYIDAVFETIPSEEVERYIYIFNNAEESERDKILEGMQPITQIYFSDVTGNPFTDYEESVAREIFPEYTKKKKKKGIFGRRERT